MTNKEFFTKILGDERSKFRGVIEALPEDKHSHKVHDKSREAGNLALQLAMQWEGISKVIKTDDISMGDYPKQQSKQQMLEMFDKNLDQLLSDVN
ncbi:MAG: hypothetical protein KW802_01985, partial [Candidatus Doudnabacteria bacterium]|nr:hypothetical protein [Candidatus Doudnabacteria bacterium]